MSAETKTLSGSGSLFLCAILLLVQPATCPAQVAATGAVPDDQADRTLAEQVRKSLVVVRATDRAGDESGIGAGFAVDQPGLIATARHVIGDGRDFIVELPDGTIAKVLEVYASSSQLDLAIIRIENTSLVPLPISIEPVTESRRLIALGHPGGKRNQTARGTYAGIFEVEGVKMLELAMPIEPGNSGGPVIT
ncbi:MAG: serine protease, partial [Planctomycetota bacterium]|nr:serine protease [Planctomycetota bacterium]